MLEKNKQLPCFAHTINLIAQKVCESENPAKLISAVKEIVRFFKHSVGASDYLRKNSNLKLIQSVPTRWNSTFYMLERFLNLSDTVSTILLKFPNSPRMLTAAELQTAKEITSILKPLESVTKEVSGDTYITGSMVIPLQNCMEKQLTELVPFTDIGQQLKQETLVEISKRFGGIEGNSLLSISTLLDPRFKKLHFKNPLRLSQNIAKIKHLIKESTPNEGKETQETLPEDLDSRENEPNIWIYHNKLAADSRKNKTESNGNFDEFDHYIRQPTADQKVNPLAFWLSNKSLYPILSEIALEYLVITATSVPSERLFSRAGYILDPARNRLSSDRFEKLLFLNSLNIADWNL